MTIFIALLGLFQCMYWSYRKKEIALFFWRRKLHCRPNAITLRVSGVSEKMNDLQLSSSQNSSGNYQRESALTLETISAAGCIFLMHSQDSCKIHCTDALRWIDHFRKGKISCNSICRSCNICTRREAIKNQNWKFTVRLNPPPPAWP